MNANRRRMFHLGRASIYGVLLLVITQTANAATVRGLLRKQAPNGMFYPAPGIAVTVYRQDLGRSASSFSGADGMYYLNLAAGPYTLEVWVSRDPRVPPWVYPIQVFEPVTDIPALNVPVCAPCP